MTTVNTCNGLTINIKLLSLTSPVYYGVVRRLEQDRFLLPGGVVPDEHSRKHAGEGTVFRGDPSPVCFLFDFERPKNPTIRRVSRATFSRLPQVLQPHP
ncbi:MAG: hypothetical protein ABFC54_06705, partial [Thermoguttaceae bacterium]